MLILFSCGGVSCTALLNMGSERMNYLQVKVWETAAEASGSCNIWRCWTGARAAGLQEPEPPLFLVRAPPCRSHKETEKSYEFYSAEKEKEKGFAALQKTALRRDGSAEKLWTRQAQEVAANTESTFTDLNGWNHIGFFQLDPDNQPKSSRIIRVILPFSLKVQIEETDVDVGGAARSHDPRLAAHTAISMFWQYITNCRLPISVFFSLIPYHKLLIKKLVLQIACFWDEFPV